MTYLSFIHTADENFYHIGNDAALQGYLTNLRNRVSDDEARSMSEYLALYNSSINNHETGDQKSSHTGRVDIGHRDPDRHGNVLTPITNNGSRSKHNDSQNIKSPGTIVTGHGRPDLSSSNRIPHAKSMQDANSKHNFTVGNASIDKADIDERIDARQGEYSSVALNMTKSVHLRDQSVNDSSNLDHLASEVRPSDALMEEDVDEGQDVVGIKTTTQSYELAKKATEMTASQVEVDNKVNPKKPDNDFPASRGFVLPYLHKSPPIENSRLSNQALDKSSGEVSNQMSDINASNKVDGKVTRKFRSAD